MLIKIKERMIQNADYISEATYEKLMCTYMSSIGKLKRHLYGKTNIIFISTLHIILLSISSYHFFKKSFLFHQVKNIVTNWKI